MMDVPSRRALCATRFAGSLHALADSQSNLRPVCGRLVGGGGVDRRDDGRSRGERGARERADQLHRVEATLADAGFPFTQNVLRKMRGLSGAEFVALGPDGTVVTSTFDGPIDRGDLPSRLPASGPPKNLDEFDAVEVAGIPYSAAVLPGNANAGIASLLILYPQENLRRAGGTPPGPRWRSAARRSCSWWGSRPGYRDGSRRIESVRGLFGRIADGEFSHVQAEPPFDEVHDLVLSANRLSDQLAACATGCPHRTVATLGSTGRRTGPPAA